MHFFASSRSLRLLVFLALVFTFNEGAEAGLRLRNLRRTTSPQPASTTPTTTTTVTGASEEAPPPTLEESPVQVTEAEPEPEVTTGKHKRGILHGAAGHLHGHWPARTYAAHYGYSLQLPGGSAFLAAAPSQRHFIKYGHGGLRPLVAGSGLVPALAQAPGLGGALLPGALTPALGTALPAALPAGVASVIPGGVATALSTGVATALGGVAGAVAAGPPRMSCVLATLWSPRTASTTPTSTCRSRWSSSRR